MARSARCTRCPFCIARVSLSPSCIPSRCRPTTGGFNSVSTLLGSRYSKSIAELSLPPFTLSLPHPTLLSSFSLFLFPSFSFSLRAREGGGGTHVTRRAFGRMPGQSARTARNVIAGSPSGDEKRALISRTLLEELSRKLSKRRELVVAGSVSWLSRVDG